tara:strand:- start:5937 stop:6773 length:837 start_codon:yes stop_codon:yes gene_type:complete
MIGMEIKRPIIIVGKEGTPKQQKAMEYLSADPIIKYANEYDVVDNNSISLERGILIKDVTYKPNIELIIDSINNYRGQIVILSNNQKDVPKKIFEKCKLKRATKNVMREEIEQIAPGSNDIGVESQNIFSLLSYYCKETDRDSVVSELKWSKPFDEQILHWVSMNIGIHKVAYIDAKVKRRWGQDYFYELLGYAHDGKLVSRPKFPDRKKKNHKAGICRKLKLRTSDYYLLEQLVKDKDFAKYASKKLNNLERRVLRLPEPVKKKRKLVRKIPTLGDF